MPGGTDEPGDGDEAEQPTILIDAKTMHCVVDLRSLIALPANSEEDALLTLRAFFLQKGKTIRVPEHAGHYATLEKYVAQVALCKVFFASSTKRPPELLVAWGDYSKLSLGMEGQFAVSLRLPLQKSFRNFEETLRYTKIEDVRGVSPINAKIQPWCTVLPLVLARQPMYALHNIKSQADIMQLMVTPLAVRIKQIAKITIAEIATIVKDTAEQDERAAEKKKGELEARLVSALKFLAQLPPKSYDKRTADRIVVLLTEKAPPPWLSSPQKSSLRKGDAVLQMTCMHGAAAAAPPPPPAVPPVPEPPKPAEPKGDDTTDGEDEFGPVTEDEVDVAPAKPQPQQIRRGKSSRTAAAPARLSDEQVGAKKPKTAKQRAAERDASLREDGINPRTKQPYRKGAYNTAGPSAASEIARLAAQKQRNDAAALKLSTDRVEMQRLKGEVVRLTAALAAESTHHTLALAAKENEVILRVQDQLLAKYQEGLRHGADLAQRGILTPNGAPMGTPASAGAV